MQIAGVAWGYEIFSKPKKLMLDYVQDAKELMKWVVLMWASLYSSKNVQLFLPPSRRLANWTYFNWMIAYNLTLLLLFLLSYLLLSYCQHLKQNQTSSQDVTLKKDNPRSAEHSANTTGIPFSRKKHKNIKENYREELGKSNPITVNENIPNNTDSNNITKMEDKELSVHVPVIFSAIGQNGMVYFLLANLLTGLINITIPTIQIYGCPAVLIISAYMAILNLIIVAMYRMNIKIF